MTAVRERGRHTALTRVLHWLTAILVFTMLMIGFVMVNSLEDYVVLVMVHRSIGVVILVVVLVRIVNRLTHRAPALPATVGAIERKIVVATELSLYALLVAQPLVGWAMVSASGRPVEVFGSVRLPPIAPFGAELFSVLRQAHALIAVALVVAIAAHVSAVLLHTLTLRDGMLSRMTPPLSRRPAEPGRR